MCVFQFTPNILLCTILAEVGMNIHTDIEFLHVYWTLVWPNACTHLQSVCRMYVVGELQWIPMTVVSLCPYAQDSHDSWWIVLS